VSVIPTNACLVFLEQGKEIHGDIFRNGFECHVDARNVLLDMYSKCGSVDMACHMFEKIFL
jgi:pentatricopeptide repeat protein